MTPMMKRLCEAASNACVEIEPHCSLDERQSKAIVQAVLLAMKDVDRPILGAVGDFNADFSFDTGRDPPFSRQLSVAINAITW